MRNDYILNRLKTVSYFLLVALLSAHVIIILLMSAVPPVSRDALIHHLYIPKLYILQGGIHELPFSEFSYYPQLIDLLYCLPLWLGVDQLAKNIHFAFAILTAFLIYFFVRKNAGRNWGLFAALFFLGIPVIVKLSVTVYIDLGLIFFSTACLLALLRWLEAPERLRWLLLSAICCGLALSSKYTALILLLLLSLIIPWYYLKNTEKQPIDQLKGVAFSTVFIFIALLVFSPWMVKNTLWTGNPLYPLFNHYFPHAQKLTLRVNTSDPVANGIGHMQRRKLLYQESWWESWSTPIRIFFQGQDNDPRYFDGKLHPLLLLIPLFILMFFRKKTGLKPEESLLLSFSIMFILLVFFKTGMRVRYVAPVIPPLIIVSVNLLARFSHVMKEQGKILPAYALPAGVVFYALFYNSTYMYSLFTKIEPLEYITGKVSREQYLTAKIPDYSVVSFANKVVNSKGKILAAYLRYRGYYFQHEVDFATGWLKKIILESSSKDEMLARLQKKGYTHIILRYDLFNEWLGYNTDAKKRTWIVSFFKEDCQIQHAYNGYGLCQLSQLVQ